MDRTPNLSQEIIEEIIRYHHGDTETLKALSTVSYRVWHICRPLLFYSLHLSAENCARWAGYLQNTPTPTLDHLELVQKLRVDLKNFSDPDEMHVLPIVDRITRPRAIILEHTDHSATPWTSMPAWLQSAVSRLISRPTVRDVQVIELICLPVSLFAGHRHLRKLQFIGSTFTTPPLPHVDLPKTPVTTLYINSTYLLPYVGQRELEELAEHPWFPFDLTDISHLHVHLTEWNISSVQHLFSICGRRLVSMSITLNASCGSLHFPHLSSLRVLHFHLTLPVFAMENEAINEISSGLLQTLEHLSNKWGGGGHALQKIIISVNFRQTNFQMFPAHFWADLDTLLVMLVNLARIRIQVFTWYGHVPDWTLLLPTLHKTGRLLLASKAEVDCASCLWI